MRQLKAGRMVNVISGPNIMHLVNSSNRVVGMQRLVVKYISIYNTLCLCIKQGYSVFEVNKNGFSNRITLADTISDSKRNCSVIKLHSIVSQILNTCSNPSIMSCCFRTV